MKERDKIISVDINDGMSTDEAFEDMRKNPRKYQDSRTNEESSNLFEKFIEEGKRTNFKLDLSCLKKIDETKEKYEKIGKERIEEISKLARINLSDKENEWFTIGYSECGQTMDQELQSLRQKLREMEKLAREGWNARMGDWKDQQNENEFDASDTEFCGHKLAEIKAIMEGV